jgi:hypothetical protein
MRQPAHRALLSLLGAAACLALLATGPASAAAGDAPRGVLPGLIGGNAATRDLDLGLTLEQNGAQVALPTEEVDGVRCAVVKLGGDELKLSARGESDWTGAKALTFRARLDGAATGPVQLIFFFQDVDYWWFQKLLRAEPAPGRWTEITVPLVPDAADAGTKYAWCGIGHDKPYDRNALRKARSVGLIILPGRSQPESPGAPRLLLAGARLIPDPAADAKLPAIYDLVSPPSVQRYECFEVAFRLDKVYANPFDPDQVDVQAQVTAPSGRTVKLFGFWYQDYRRCINGRDESLVPVGEPSWRVRFAPSEVGPHTYTISVRDASGVRTTKPRRFEVLDGPSDGFLRVSERDCHYLEFDSGRPWWGIGLNLHCTYDYRYNSMVRGGERLLETQRGSCFYDDRLKKSAENGMNWTEFWIASWGFEIEWRGDWRGWAGAGQYSLENAWRLDRALAECHDLGVYANLVLTCHGAYMMSSNQQSTGSDAEFQHHAYYRGNGGWLDDGGQIFTDPRAREAMRKRLRYIVARYAHSTSIACWEMMSESDLVPGGRNASLPFVLAMADMVKEMDPYAHPTGNHYCGSYGNLYANCARDPRMNVVAGDAYRGGPGQRGADGTQWGIYFDPYPKHLELAAQSFAPYRKPVFITEAGGSWFAGPAPLLEADVHALNWAAWMTTLPATPLTWWEDFVDERDLWGEYAAFARYAAGEDKRARGLETSEAPATDQAGQPITALTTLMLKSRTGGYAWVYDECFFEFGSTQMLWQNNLDFHALFHLERERPTRRFDAAVAVIGGLDDGAFTVEVWDTTAGAILSTSDIESKGGTLRVPLPAFSRDIALKFSRRLY